MIFDHPHFYLGDEIFVPAIFDAGPGEAVPEGFNAVRILLDGRMRTHLDWREALQQAEAYRAQGLKLFWDLDLGLFARLSMAFSDEMQFRCLALSVDHFLHELWPKFMEDTLALALFRGSADFSQGFPWCHERQEAFDCWLKGRPDSPFLRRLFCREVCVQYLEFLTGGFPATLQAVLLLDAGSLGAPAEAAQLLSREKLARFFTAVRGGLLPIRELAWEGASKYGFIGRRLMLVPATEPRIGVCTHPEQMSPGLQQAIEELVRKRTPFRLLSETYLTSEWDGLDELIVGEIPPEVQRKLQGFLAAGGTVTKV